MKVHNYLYFILAFSNICYASGANSLRYLRINSCFQFNHKINKAHKWEKDRVIAGLPWALLDRDNTAIYVAQPSSFCQENDINFNNCKYYWKRTVEFKDDWMDLEGNPTPVDCPKGFLKRLKK